MPSPDQILAGLGAIANTARPFAVFWHLYFAAAVAFILIRRPSARIAGLLLAPPLLSVSIFAWVHGNPFNGAVFALAFVVMLVLSIRLSREPVRLAPPWVLVPGVLLLLFGWAYPHFLVTTSPLPYLYSAPTGLIPCPTLSAIIGVVLMLAGLGSRALTLTLSAVGLFYGLFGVGRLGVKLDAALLAGAAFLAVVAFVRPRPVPVLRPRRTA